MTTRWLCVTMDLDPLGAYHRIHGLEPPPAELRHHLSQIALPRLRGLLERLGIRASLFVVGEDLASETIVRELGAAAREGHELANHTETHPYDLLDRPLDFRRGEIRRCHDRLTALLGEPPVGFRAPGYFIDGPTLGLLGAMGYGYDSSMLPSLPYYAAKTGVMAWMRLRGRTSLSRRHPLSLLAAPATPYRPDGRRPWRRGSAPLVEIPAASLVGGVPLVGTFLAGLGPAVARLLAIWLAPRSFVTVELHAIDLVALSDGGLDPISRHQPGVATPLERRLASLETLLRSLARNRTAAPLRAVAESLAPAR